MTRIGLRTMDRVGNVWKFGMPGKRGYIEYGLKQLWLTTGHQQPNMSLLIMY
jgi:hypothetical protein